MIGSKFLTAQTIDLRGTQWEKPNLKSVPRPVREIVTATGTHYEATLYGRTVRVERRGKFWAVTP